MKTVLITGAAKGIGAAIAEELARDEYQVIINYKTSEQKAKELKEKLTKDGLNVEIYKADVAKKEEVQKMVQDILKKYGKIDVLINNAGISQIKPFANIEEEDWDAIMNNNLKSVYLVTKEVISNMIQNQEGTIINISSIWGITGGSCEVHYSTAKAGIIGITKAMAKEFASRKICVNAIAPGFIQTDMTGVLPEDTVKNIMNIIPIKRLGNAEDVANLAVFLASDLSDYITGEVIAVDGGMSM